MLTEAGRSDKLSPAPEAPVRLFPYAYMFRLTMLRPLHGEVSKTRWTRSLYAVFRPLWPLVRALTPGSLIQAVDSSHPFLWVSRDGGESFHSQEHFKARV